jgi:hypothetical protein
MRRLGDDAITSDMQQTRNALFDTLGGGGVGTNNNSDKSRQTNNGGAAAMLSAQRSAISGIEAQQDLVLDDMSAAISRLHDTSTAIGGDLEDQTQLLQSMDDDMDAASVLMAKAEDGVRDLLQRSGYSRHAVILCLSLFAAFLFLLILFG